MVTRRAVLVAVAAVALTGSLVGHAALRQATGTISGRILDADTGRPVAGANVAVARGPATQSGGDGRYELRGVAAGQAAVRVWGAAEYIATSLVVPRGVTLPAGGSLSDVDFQVRLEAELSGRVLDERGVPLAGVLVTAVTRGYSRQERYGGDPELAAGLWHFQSARATTDDRGVYRFSRLSAGRPYWIVAHPRRSYGSPVSAAPGAADARAPVLTTTFFPSADSMDTATPLVLSSLEQRGGIDVIMRRAPAFCLEARTLLNGAPAPTPFAVEDEAIARLVTAATTSALALRQSGVSDPSGRLRVCDLPPGLFRLTIAESFSPHSPGARGWATVRIDRSDPDAATVAAHSPVLVDGVVTVVGRQASEPVVSKLTVAPVTRIFGARPAVTTVPGAFSLELGAGVPYAIEIPDLPAGLYVASATIDGVDTMHQPLAPTPDSTPTLRIELSDMAGSIVTTVADARGRPANGAFVIAIPERATSHVALAIGVRAAVTDETGSVAIVGLPPGGYFVLATDTPPPSTVSWPSGKIRVDKSPETLDTLLQMRARGERVEVRPRSRTAVIARTGR